MVQRRPGADLVTLRLQRRRDAGLESRLEMDEAGRRVQPRPRHRSVGLEPLVQDSRDDLNQRAAQPRPACRAGGEHDPVCVDGDARRHHARHPLARLEPSADEIGLAEHAVQMEVEPGKEIARAEAEARREHAGAARSVDHTQVGRVTLHGSRVERARECHGPLGRRDAA